MPEANADDYLLLGCFAEFYEEVAAIKQAAAENRLGTYLAVDGQQVANNGTDYALRVGGILMALLQRQARDVRRTGTEAEIKAYSLAQYAMAALADELFILDVDWPGQEAWLETLLEARLFDSRRAGRQFFESVAQVLSTRGKTQLHVDLGSVFLLCLQLGFKGMYRGDQGVAPLQALREKLYQFVNGGNGTLKDKPAFPQAYLHPFAAAGDFRLAPLRPWLVAGGAALLSYLLATTAIWLAFVQPLQQAVKG